MAVPGGTGNASPNEEKLDEIFECIRENDEKRLHNLLEQDQTIADLLTTERDETTALHKSVGQVQCVKLMLSYGAQANTSTQDGTRPIHVAAERDFVESLMLLVIYGADFNAKTANNKTPLHIAVENQARACRDFLHFLGAQIEDYNILKDESFREKLKTIQQGYRDKKVFCGGKDVPKSTGAKVEIEDWNDKKFTIGIEGNSEPFRLYVRRMLVDYQYCSVRVPEVKLTHGMDLVSDIYQYWVDKTVECDIYVPLVGKFKQDSYKSLILKQTTSFGDSGEVITNTVNIVDGKAFAKGVTLFANGSSHFVAFGIFTTYRVDEKKVDPNQDTKVTSSVLDQFMAIVPAGTAPLDTRIKLKVLKVDSSDQSSDSGVDSTTDFCSVEFSSDEGSDVTSTDKVTAPQTMTLCLPIAKAESSKNSSQITDSHRSPIINSSPIPRFNSKIQTFVMTCNQGSNGLDADNWKALDGNSWEPNKSRVMCKCVMSGLYMVLNVCKEFGRWLKEMVRDLYEFSIGAKVKCKLFAVLKQSETVFLVHVVLCSVDKYVHELRDCLVQGYHEQESGPTDVFEIDSKCLLMLHIEMIGAKVQFANVLPIQYQGGVSKSQTFMVCPEQNKQAYGVIFSFKRTVPKEKYDYGRKCKTTLPISFEKCKINSISEGVFLSDKAIKEMAENTIGDKWFVLGIYLGFSGEYLVATDGIEPMARNQMVLYKWRDTSYPSISHKLDKLVSASAIPQAALPKLIKALVSEVERHIDQNREELQSWLKRFNSQEGQKEISTPIIVSPLSDPFLVLVAKQLLVDDTFFFRLDLYQQEYNGCNRISNETQRKFKLLMLARDKRPDTMRFLQDLVRTLSEDEQQLTCRILRDQVRSWLGTDDGKAFSDKATLMKIFKLH